MKTTFKSLLASLLFYGASALAQPPQKVIVVIFENTDYDGAIGQPFFAKFAEQGTLLTDYHAVAHPSQPNYIGMMAGTTDGVTLDFSVNLDESNLGDLLEAKGRSWHVYAENYPGKCFQGSTSGRYARKHNPMISFDNVHSNSTRCAKITDASNFAADFKAGKLADFTMLVPNLDDDGHDTSVAYANNWFEKTFGPLIQDPVAMKGVMIVATFDEDDDAHGNHIYSALYGPDVLPGLQISSTYDHYSLLRTIEDLFQLGTLGRGDATATPITGFYK